MPEQVSKEQEAPQDFLRVKAAEPRWVHSPNEEGLAVFMKNTLTLGMKIR